MTLTWYIQLLCSLHVQAPARMANGNTHTAQASASTSSLKRKDMGIQTEPVVVVTLENVRHEQLNDGMAIEVCIYSLYWRIHI